MVSILFLHQILNYTTKHNTTLAACLPFEYYSKTFLTENKTNKPGIFVTINAQYKNVAKRN